MPARTVRLAVCAAALLASACDGSATTTAIPEPDSSTLQAGRWGLVRAMGQTLPAAISHRLVDGVLIQEFVDSARLEIHADGRYSQMAWITVKHNQAPHGVSVLLDEGTWARDDEGYRLQSAWLPRQTRLGHRSATRLTARERLVLIPEVGLTDTEYAPLPDDPSGAPIAIGAFRVGAVDGGLPPAVVRQTTFESEVDRLRSVVTAGSLVLRPDGWYEISAQLADWYSPDARFFGNEVLRGTAIYLDRGRWTRSGDALRLVSEDRAGTVITGQVNRTGSVFLTHRFSDNMFEKIVLYFPAAWPPSLN